IGTPGCDLVIEVGGERSGQATPVVGSTENDRDLFYSQYSYRKCFVEDFGKVNLSWPVSSGPPDGTIGAERAYPPPRDATLTATPEETRTRDDEGRRPSDERPLDGRQRPCAAAHRAGGVRPPARWVRVDRHPRHGPRGPRGRGEVGPADDRAHREPGPHRVRAARP